VIFSVAPQRVLVYDRSGTAVVAGHATAEGGFLAARSADRLLEASFGVSHDWAGLRVTEGGVDRVELGRRPGGSYAMRFVSSAGGALAGLGESHARSGALLVSDTGERLRASMTVPEGRGGLTLFNVGGAPIASVRENTAGAGLFAIGTPSGDQAVKMTVNDDRYGAVLAGPRLGFPYVPRTGLPGSYFLGCAGGEGCRPH
jgi:hypothetical protein